MKQLLLPILILGGVLGAAPLSAQLKIPKGYAELKTSPANGGMMKRTAVHLDGDNKPDQVSVISLKDKPTEDVMLVFYFTQSKTQEIIRLNPADEKEIFMFPLRVVNHHLEFAYGMKGDKNFARYIRLGYHKELNQAVLSNYETYFKQDGKSSLKTYNLLTGEFKIDYSELEPSSNKIFRNAKFGKEQQEPLAVAKYSDNFLQNLDAIMRAKENEKVLAEQVAPVKPAKTKGKKKR